MRKLFVFVLVCACIASVIGLFMPNNDPAQEMSPIYLSIESDASETPIRVKRLVRVPEDQAATEELLQQLLRDCSRTQTPIAVVGGRHAKAGQSVAPGGVIVDMRPFCEKHLDPKRRWIRVGAGARWSDVERFLADRDYRLQTYPDDLQHTLGGAVSGNLVHSFRSAQPLASVVKALRIVLADGSVVTCSREQEPELFHTALGGFGLVGVITEVTLYIQPATDSLLVESYDTSAWDQYYVPQDRVEAFVALAESRSFEYRDSGSLGETESQLLSGLETHHGVAVRAPDGESSVRFEFQSLALELGAANALGGSLMMDREQFVQRYPGAIPFFQEKRKRDPQSLFVNLISLRYQPFFDGSTVLSRSLSQ